ncbi:MAG: PAS domain S-box protein, partial [Chloroflexota bacterium]|nr:PAS domain S-box protein [Chloroflexota bacterium]
MSAGEKTKDQLAKELEKAQRRIVELEARAVEHKRTEQALRESENRFRLLVENAPDIIFTYDLDGTFLYGNKKTKGLLGYSSEELIGRSLAESGLLPNNHLLMAMDKIEENRRGIVTGPDEYELVAKDGARVFMEVRGVPIVHEETVEVIAIARDITEHKKAQEALRESEEKLRAMFSAIDDGVTVTDMDGNVTDMNQTALRMFGYRSKRGVSGLSSFKLLAEKDRAKALDDMTIAFQAGRGTATEYTLITKSGKEFSGEVTTNFTKDDSGNPTGFISVTRDISERKRMEDHLRQSEERYRRLAENTPALICTFLPDSTLNYANTAYCKYFQKRYNELTGQKFLDFLPGDRERRMVKKQYMSLTVDNPSTTYEHTTVAPDGGERWQRWTDQAFFNKKGKAVGFQSIGFDITERKRAEEALKESEEKFRIIFGSIADGISVIDLSTGKLIDTNEAALRMFNFARNDIIGMDAFELIAEKDRERAMEDSINTLQTGDSGLAEWCLLGKGGTEHD